MASIGEMTVSIKVGTPLVGQDPLQFFGYAHLPEHLQEASKIFHDLAEKMLETCPDNPQREMALQKLIEAKDCAVRSRLYKWKEIEETK